MITTMIFFACYLIGSINSAILICKLLGLTDPRELGSHNPGATNIWRIANKSLAAIVLLLDGLKGFLPMLIAQPYVHEQFLPWLLLTTVIGHIFPIFFHFKGGKGVATMFGGLLALNLPIAAIALASWLITVLLVRIASLGSIIAMLSVPISALFIADGWLALSCTSLIIIVKHHENLRRLLNKQETQL